METENLDQIENYLKNNSFQKCFLKEQQKKIIKKRRKRKRDSNAENLKCTCNQKVHEDGEKSMFTNSQNPIPFYTSLKLTGEEYEEKTYSPLLKSRIQKNAQSTSAI